MDFGKILDQWDKQTGSFYKKDIDSSIKTAETSALRRRRLLSKSPEAVIDLHGLNRDEAWDALSSFFNEAKNKGLEKILIIHGKGTPLYASGDHEVGILKKIVRDFIERCPFAGEHGYSSVSSGGTGSTWVLLKRAS